MGLAGPASTPHNDTTNFQAKAWVKKRCTVHMPMHTPCLKLLPTHNQQSYCFDGLHSKLIQPLDALPNGALAAHAAEGHRQGKAQSNSLNQKAASSGPTNPAAEPHQCKVPI